MYFSRPKTEFRQRTTIWFQRKVVQVMVGKNFKLVHRPVADRGSADFRHKYHGLLVQGRSMLRIQDMIETLFAQKSRN
jgi:hypothetical protein